MRYPAPTRRQAVFGAATVAAAALLALAAIRVGVDQTAQSRAYIGQPPYGVWGGLLLHRANGASYRRLWTRVTLTAAHIASER